MEAFERNTLQPLLQCVFCTFGGAQGHRTGAGVATGYGGTPVEPLEDKALLESRNIWDGFRIMKQESSNVVQRMFCTD